MASSWPDFAVNTTSNRHKVDILEQCLRHGSSPQTTGAELAAAASLEKNLKDGLSSTWIIIMSAIRVFGSNEDISKIADILITFASLAPAEDKRSAESNAFATRSWKTLGWALNEEWDGFITSPDSYRDETAYSEAITRFLAINKFVANLARAGIARYNLYILWTMRTALEYSPEQRMRRDDPEVYVLAAAACVVIAGEKIRSYDEEFPPGELTGRPAEGGPLWEGKHGFCEGRWRLWKERFWAVAGEQGRSEKVRAVAKDAYDEMERIDREV